MENVKLFHKLNNEIKNLQIELDRRNEKLDELLINSILVETNSMLENTVVKWVSNNPIEAISYYLAIKNKFAEIFFKNNDDYVELFEDSCYDEHNCYALINRNTLDIKVINASDMVDYYSNLECGNEVCIELDFLDNKKLPLIREVGSFIHDNSWTTQYDCLHYQPFSKTIYNIIDKNFTVNEDYSIPEEFELSNRDINELLLEHKSKLDVSFDTNKTFAVYNLSNAPKLIGFIEISFYKNALHDYEIEIGNFKIFEDYKEMNYEPKILDMIEETYSTEIGEIKEPMQ